MRLRAAALALALSGLATTTAQATPAAPTGAVWIIAPPVLRHGTLEVDGESTGVLPPKGLLLLSPGTHQLALAQGRWRLMAEVKVQAGHQAVVRWPRLGVVDVSYPPMLEVLIEPKDIAAPLRQAVIDTIRRAHYSRLGEFGIPNQLVTPSQCGETPACMEEQSQVHGLRHVLAVQVASSASGYILAVRLFDNETGDLAAQRSDDCSGCTPEKASAKLSALCIEVLHSGTTRPLGLLEITSQPPGGEVLVDGRKLGITPYRRSASVGDHGIVVHKTGYLDYQNSVDVGSGRGSAIDITLHPDTPEKSRH